MIDCGLTPVDKSVTVITQVLTVLKLRPSKYESGFPLPPVWMPAKTEIGLADRLAAGPFYVKKLSEIRFPMRSVVGIAIGYGEARHACL